jgi:hypothetical protein
MRVAALMLAALAFASAFAGAATTAPLSSGVRGEVMRGPTKPVCSEIEPCEEPAVGVVLRFSRAGRIVARAKTGAAGRYAVRLRAGVYAVTLETRRRFQTLSPRQVRVPVARMARADFFIDTGIQ